jgi:hypothetical protein
MAEGRQFWVKVKYKEPVGLAYYVITMIVAADTAHSALAMVMQKFNLKPEGIMSMETKDQDDK